MGTFKGETHAAVVVTATTTSSSAAPAAATPAASAHTGEVRTFWCDLQRESILLGVQRTGQTDLEEAAAEHRLVKKDGVRDERRLGKLDVGVPGLTASVPGPNR